MYCFEQCLSRVLHYKESVEQESGPERAATTRHAGECSLPSRPTQSAQVTCRTRHINCDGKKPQCGHCTSTGQFCKRNKHSQSRSASPTSSVRSRHFLSIAAAPDTKLFTSSQEHRSFTFFCQYTVPQISSAFSDEFWNRLVLQATHHEPAIRHAAIAMGALH